MVDGQFKLVIGSAFAIFLIAAIFWAGASYQRITSIEGHLSSIDTQMANILSSQSDINTIRERMLDNQKRLDKLEDQVRQLR